MTQPTPTPRPKAEAKALKKQTREIREKWLQIRLTKSEHKAFKSRIPPRYSMTQFIYELVMDEPIQQNPFKKPTYPKADPKLIQEVLKIGVNLNQITKALHKTEINYSELFYLLAEISEQLDILINVQGLENDS